MTDGQATPQDDREPRATLVPIDDEGTFLVLGDVPGFGVLPAPYLSTVEIEKLDQALVAALGVVGTGVSALGDITRQAGVVRLAPETLRLLQAGVGTLTDGVWNLGTLVADGKFVAQVRWVPASTPGLGGAIAALGPTLGLLSVLWQLSGIAGAVERNLALTKTLLDEVRSDRWHELQAAAGVVLAEAAHARKLGEVTPLLWATCNRSPLWRF